ncbi:hypothetical protein EJ357_47490 [Streptomyces cyaneochromogenes]|uniref:Uncharacterized protein n=1 Tax=Streptomyces cyaneochromogenes TaxID=2496836 RepID=A0A3S5HT49_9ACTN|nr:hypothetical protein [Streptomyces cyaneochromogenes]AZQ32139.1 hypothetical protein EJ357_00440 [Streptomyces cyaneochromogenes]AZQ40084.1 hypothetical protein EJ357_47490 [Streptomyces cyaneochromogenes]
MTKALNPQRRVVGGRALVNRDWIREYTGASGGSAARWYKVRDEQPQEHRHPEKERIEGTDFYDEQQFRSFYTWFQAEKASKVLKADPELYELDPEDVVSINKAAELLNFSGASVIRKYQQANPGYFPAPAGEVEGPTGRMIQAFRVGDLQAFDGKRTGDKLGKAGRRPGPQPEAPVGRRSALEEALASELSARGGIEPLTATQLAAQYAAQAIERDGYHPGLAAELSAQYGGPQRSWEYVVRNARKHHPEATPSPSPAGRRVEIALTALRERGDVRGLAASLAREHGGSPDVWSRAVNTARTQLTEPTT